MQEWFSRFAIKRKAMVGTLVGSLVLILTASHFTGFFFISRLEMQLDEELGRRLQAIANLLARSTELDINTSAGLEVQHTISGAAASLLEIRLDAIRVEHNLQAIYIVDSDFRTLLACPKESFPKHEIIDYLAGDSLTIQRALLEGAATSALRQIAGEKFKTGYAPVRNILDETIAIVVVEASADFLSSFERYQRMIWVGLVASLVIIVIYGLFTFWMVTFFIRAQESMQKNERLAAMGQMAASVAHEIRNPLGIIKNTAEVLRNVYRKPGDDDELFSFIPSEVERLNRLLNDFLTFARNPELKLKEHDLASTIESALRAFENEAAGRDIAINFKSENRPLQVPHSEDALRQVMLNLISNAMDAMKGKGAIEVRARLKQKWHAKAVEVTVEDNGRGIEGKPENIFDPSFTTKTKGSGLGLAVTQQIIQRHRGEITAENATEGGTVIRFYIPL